jgi:mRNA interferase HicA
MKTMKSKEFKHWLAKQGATFAPGKGSHLKVYLNRRQSNAIKLRATIKDCPYVNRDLL